MMCIVKNNIVDNGMAQIKVLMILNFFPLAGLSRSLIYLYFLAVAEAADPSRTAPIATRAALIISHSFQPK